MHIFLVVMTVSTTNWSLDFVLLLYFITMYYMLWYGIYDMIYVLLLKNIKLLYLHFM
jgi:hypothetical protein